MNCELWPGFNFEHDEMPGYILDYREQINNFEYFGISKVIIPGYKYKYIGRIGFHVNEVNLHIFDYGKVKRFKQLDLFE